MMASQKKVVHTYFHGTHLFKSDVDSRHHSAEPYHCSIITDLYLKYNMNVPASARKESVNIEICNLQKLTTYCAMSCGGKDRDAVRAPETSHTAHWEGSRCNAHRF